MASGISTFFLLEPVVCKNVKLVSEKGQQYSLIALDNHGKENTVEEWRGGN